MSKVLERESVLDAENWKLEAQAVINDVKEHVKDIAISEKLGSSDVKVYFNFETLEGEKFCVELSRCGFRIVGNSYDVIELFETEETTKYFETPNSLLSQISLGFIQSFANALSRRLQVQVTP